MAAPSEPAARPLNVKFAVLGPVGSQVPTDAPSEPMLTSVPSAMKASYDGGLAGSWTSGSITHEPTSGWSAMSCRLARLTARSTPTAPARMAMTSAITSMACRAEREPAVPVVCMVLTSVSPSCCGKGVERLPRRCGTELALHAELVPDRPLFPESPPGPAWRTTARRQLTRRPEGGTPRNSPWCVPASANTWATRLPSAMSTSTIAVRSGNARRRLATH